MAAPIPTAEPAFWTFDPGKVTIVFNGVNIGGLAEGTFVEVERRRVLWEMLVGCSGAVARASTSDTTGRASFTVFRESPTADYLYALVTDDEDNWTGVGAFTLTDQNTLTSAHSSEAWLSHSPKITRSKGGDTVTFELLLADLDIETNTAGL